MIHVAKQIFIAPDYFHFDFILNFGYNPESILTLASCLVMIELPGKIRVPLMNDLYRSLWFPLQNHFCPRFC